MIQRLQSLYLALAAITLIVTTFCVNRAGGSEPIAVAALLLAGMLAVASLISVFLYANRGRQHNVVRWIRIGSLLLLFALGLWIFGNGSFQILSSDEAGRAIVAVVASLVAVGLVHFAKRAIKKDIDLVKSIDRIR